jgi:hypothetical protein
VRSEETPFEGGPLDGWVLPVLVGATGHPPRVYEVPVPSPGGRGPTVYVYRRVSAGHTGRVGLRHGWKYAYDPDGRPTRGLTWPWSRAHRALEGDTGGQKKT